MNTARYEEVRHDLLQEAYDIENAKRPAYTGENVDVLHNFKTTAQRAGITTRQAWLIYFLKHVDSVSTWAKNPNAPQGEPIVGRFADIINYCKLGYAIEVEEAEEHMRAAIEAKERESRIPSIREIMERLNSLDDLQDNSISEAEVKALVDKPIPVYATEPTESILLTDAK
jgi:hypothetical protein